MRRISKSDNHVIVGGRHSAPDLTFDLWITGTAGSQAFHEQSVATNANFAVLRPPVNGRRI